MFCPRRVSSTLERTKHGHGTGLDRIWNLHETWKKLRPIRPVERQLLVDGRLNSHVNYEKLELPDHVLNLGDETDVNRVVIFGPKRDIFPFTGLVFKTTDITAEELPTIDVHHKSKRRHTSSRFCGYHHKRKT